GIGRSDIGVAAAAAAGFTLLRARQRTRLRPITPPPGFVGDSPDKRGRVLRQGPRNWGTEGTAWRPLSSLRPLLTTRSNVAPEARAPASCNVTVLPLAS